MIHKNPFECLIIRQSLEHNLVPMTENDTIARYPNDHPEDVYFLVNISL
jgi:PIN domain nuclease of toxin-antitoxin system